MQRSAKSCYDILIEKTHARSLGSAMAERVGRERILREHGYLYYLANDGYIWRLPTKSNPTGTKSRVGTEKIAREEGCMYFLDKDGYVARARRMAGEPRSNVSRSPAPALTAAPTAGGSTPGNVCVVELSGWDNIWIVQALMALLSETHNVSINSEKGRWKLTFRITIRGPDALLCKHRLSTFALGARWKLNDIV